MKYRKNLKKILENVIWITGCGRSGTTILGKILSTCKNVEYAFEPEFLFGLLPKIKKINKHSWLDIYNTYIIEELFYNLCTGRRINFKKHDWSYIGYSLSKKEINNKLKIDIGRGDFDNFLKKNKKLLIIKVPDLARSLNFFQKYYPKNKFIVTKRNTEPITRSILKRKWFRDTNNLSFIHQDPEVLGPKIYKRWKKLNEINKTKLYINTVNKNSEKLKNKYIFSYEKLLRNPKKEIDKVCSFLNIKKTKKTLKIIKTVKKQK